MTKNLEFFLTIFLISLPFWWGVNIFQKNLENFFYAQISQPFEEMVFVQIPKRVEKPKPELNAKSALSLKINQSGREKTLFQKNPEEILPIASLTKLMTALIVLEDKENYDFQKTLITISKEAANQENAPNYGNLDREIGKKFTLEQLLDLMLIYSSNDAAWALAEVIRVENFVEKMNEKAEELDLKNTHFVNPHGLDPHTNFDVGVDSENIHYSSETLNHFNHSTAKDLVKLAQYILENHPLIFEISLKKGPHPVKNGISDLVLTENKKSLGGKTGYTREAGGSMVFLFQDEKGNILVNVVLGAESEKVRVEEMQKLIDWINL